MSYGVLHFRSRDGRAVELPLDRPSMVIGRADDSGLSLRDASVARRHARISVEGTTVYIQDLGAATGTWVNGEQLAPNERMPIFEGDTLRFGDVEASYARASAEPPPQESPASGVAPPAPVPAVPSPSAVAPATPVAPPLRATIPPAPIVPPVAAAAAVPSSSSPPKMTISVEMAENRVAPGGVGVATISVQNRGSTVEQITLAVNGLPPEWFTLAPTSGALLPGSRLDATLTIRPPRTAAALAGERTFEAVAALRVAGGQVSASGSLNVLPFDALTLELSPRQSDRNFRLAVANEGNRTVRLRFTADDDEAQLEFDFQPHAVDVAAGTSQTVAIEAKKPGRPMTGQRAVVPFTIHALQEGAPKRDVAAALAVQPRFGKGLPMRKIMALIALVIAAGLGYLFFPRGGDEVPATGDGTPPPAEASAIAANATVSTVGTAAVAPAPDFLCGPDAPAAGPPPVAGELRPAPAIAVAIRRITGSDPSSPMFAQNDTRWGKAEYAKASDEQFRSQNTCGSTIEQCGCAMTSVATVMALFQLVAMPDGKPLTPESLNAWFNLGAKQTAAGWVSQGYVYGNVIWASANQLSGAIKQANPAARTVRFKGVGSGSEEQIRAELAAGRPIVLEVPGHWIAAIGIDANTNQILINDPYYADRTTLDVYEGKVRSSVLFEASDNLSAIVVSVPSSARVKVTDDQGNVTGTHDGGPANETAAKAQNDIQGAAYTYTAAWRDPTCTEKPPPAGAGTIQVVLPAGRGYTIDIVNPAKGATSVAVHAYDDRGNVAINTQDAPGDLRLTLTPRGGATTVAVTPTAGTGTGTGTGAPPTAAATTQATSASATTPATTAPASATTAATATAAPTTAATATTVPTAAPGAPVVRITCSDSVVAVTQFPVEDSIDCALAISSDYDRITWYYNHGRCEPPRGGGVCTDSFGFPPTELFQWTNGTSIKGFGAYTETPETFTFIAEVCKGSECTAQYAYVEYRQGGRTN